MSEACSYSTTLPPGCTLPFVPTARMYQPLSALAVLAGLNAKGFSGVCECYIRPGIRDGEYQMGVGLRFAGAPPPDEWWGDFVGSVGYACAEDEEVRLNRAGCEFASVGELRAAMHARASASRDGHAHPAIPPASPRRYGLADALHLAAAIESGCDVFLTNDNQLANFPDITVEELP